MIIQEDTSTTCGWIKLVLKTLKPFGLVRSFDPHLAFYDIYG